MKDNQLFKEETLAKKLLTKGFWLYFFAFIIAPTGYLIRTILSNDLGVSDIGIIYSLLGLVSILVIYGDLGNKGALNYFIPKFLAKGEDKKVGFLIGYTIIFQIFFSIIISLLIYFGADVISNIYLDSYASKTFIYYIIAYFILLNLYGLVNNILNSFQEIFYQRFSNAIRMWLIFAFTLSFFLFENGSIENYFLTWILGGVIAFVLSCIFLYIKALKKVKLQKIDISYNKDTLKSFHSYGLWALLGGQAGVVMGQIDLQMVLFLAGTESAGYYTNFKSLFMIQGMFIGPIMQLFLPIITELIEKKENFKIKILQNIYYNYFGIIFFALGVFFLLFGDIVSIVLFGDHFLLSGILLQFIALFLVLKVLFQFNFVVINAYGKPKNRVKIIAFAALVNILINGALIPFIGVYGAVISSIIAWFMMFLFSFIYIYKKNPIILYRGFLFGNIVYFLIVGLILYSLKGIFFEYTNSARYENLLYLMIAFAIFGLGFLIINYKSLLKLKKEVVKIRKN
ncbi:oligosaccharide flippase family protein [Candidatus Vampirococcus lugosii]|uniref:Polysaccharide biosynthesis protein n=1 Tax=Candidatus Vampirococcus lugosii TaxID=2789015 RepID=A0ABS5QJT7_9BACT|nr:polysaccharide biosynthesis C-terminal domain-containing protein [Candidatus Vampirococcus lugosii]MBS8121532.1 polysaccharide biosynthesis protein [Candidatus Vampirococcus lugosii]